MCGRYALYGPSSRLREQFGVEPTEWVERFNIAPGAFCPVIREASPAVRAVLDARWGLVPSWVREPGKLPQPINAKIETAGDKPMFRHALRHARVLVPASGFFEWKPGRAYKQPYFIRPAGDGLFGLGALLEHHEGESGVLYTFSILTCPANELMAGIHERMPVIIAPEDYHRWLDPTLTDPDPVQALAGTYAAAAMCAFAVSREVGHARAQGPRLVARLEGV